MPQGWGHQRTPSQREHSGQPCCQRCLALPDYGAVLSGTIGKALHPERGHFLGPWVGTTAIYPLLTPHSPLGPATPALLTLKEGERAGCHRPPSGGGEIPAATRDHRASRWDHQRRELTVSGWSVHVCARLRLGEAVAQGQACSFLVSEELRFATSRLRERGIDLSTEKKMKMVR